jgi:hypothetical protein
MEEPTKDVSLKEIYLGYYNYITDTNPFRVPISSDSLSGYKIPVALTGMLKLNPYIKANYFMEIKYNGFIKWYVKKPPYNLLHIKDEDGKPIVSWRDARGLWCKALKESPENLGIQ